MDRFYGQHGHWFRVLNLGGPPVSLTTLIADTRKAVTDDAANARATVSAQGTLVGITEVDVRTGAYLHGGRAARTRWCRRGGEPGSVRPGIARVMPGDHLPLPGRAVAVAPSGWPGRAADPAAQCAPGPRPGRRRADPPMEIHPTYIPGAGNRLRSAWELHAMRHGHERYA